MLHFTKARLKKTRAIKPEWYNFGPVTHASAAKQLVEIYVNDRSLPDGKYVVETRVDGIDAMHQVQVEVSRSVKVVGFPGSRDE